MWHRIFATPPWAIDDIELSEDFSPITLRGAEMGAFVMLRWRGRPVEALWLSRADHGGVVEPEMVRRLVGRAAQERAAAAALLAELVGDRSPAPVPSLTVAVCTRNRPALLRRCLAALVAMRDARPDAGQPIDILVVDNAPDDDATREAAAAFPGVRYAVEPVPGLDMGRNRALAETDRTWLAFVDDDAVIDRLWLEALAEGVRESSSAAGFTGPILPLRLETEAQIRFEASGGFGKGFDWRRMGPESFGDPVYPAGPGGFGTGACMVFRVEVLRALGGFDEALDTGPPLPGGGDIDMFYRVVRSGQTLVYLPGLIVWHEHRRDMPGLARQYDSWGRGTMTLVEKNRSTDPAMRGRHRLMLLWYATYLGRRLVRALLGRGLLPPGLVLAEIRGAIGGAFGEYRRSQARMARRKAERAT